MRIFSAMSGTSTDGISYVIFDIDKEFKFNIIKNGHKSYSKKIKTKLLNIAESRIVDKAEIAKLHWELGKILKDIYEKESISCDLGVFSGHTIYHDGPRKITLQIGDVTLLNYSSKIPVVTDLRYSDIAAGNQGAPLVPFADSIIYGKDKIILNIGGISNITVTGDRPYGFDSGPGNMLLDQAMRFFYRKDMDLEGELSLKGEILEDLIKILSKDNFISKKPPKSTGRERYGREFFEKIIEYSKRENPDKEDIIATLAYFTSYSIYKNIVNFIGNWKNMEIICAGGGCKNKGIIERLEILLNKKIIMSDNLGVPWDARESLAFGIIAYLSLLMELGIDNKGILAYPYGKITIASMEKSILQLK